MANRLEHNDDDELSEILRRAVRKEGRDNVDLHQRLLAAADELGISHQAVAEAESEYRQESTRQHDIALYTKETRGAFRYHLGIYAIINVFMVALNLMTFHDDHEIWFPYVLLSWGIGLAVHAFIALRKTDWDDEEFQKWRRERAEEQALPPSAQM
jgi:2TM domain-containing protein